LAENSVTVGGEFSNSWRRVQQQLANNLWSIGQLFCKLPI